MKQVFNGNIDAIGIIIKMNERFRSKSEKSSYGTFLTKDEAWFRLKA